MKKFSHYVNESQQIETSDGIYYPIYEGMISDFLKVAKDKLFSGASTYIERDQANYYKHLFTMTLIMSLDKLKYKKISFQNFILRPKEVLKQAQVILSDDKILKDISGHEEDNEQRLRFRPQDEGRIVPLIDEIYEVAQDIEKRLKKYAQDHIERKYSTNPLAKNPGANKRIQERFMTEFNTIFMPTKKKIRIFNKEDEGKEQGTIKGSSKFEILAYKILRAMKRSYGFDVENMFIIPKDYDLTTGYTIHGMKDKNREKVRRSSVSSDEILKAMEDGGYSPRKIESIFAQFQKDTDYVIQHVNKDDYYDIFFEAFTREYIRAGKIDNMKQYAIVDNMVKIIEENDLDLPTKQSIRKEELLKQEEEDELDKELDDEEGVEYDEDDVVVEPKPKKEAPKQPKDYSISDVPKPGAKRGRPVEVVGNLEDV